MFEIAKGLSATGWRSLRDLPVYPLRPGQPLDECLHHPAPAYALELSPAEPTRGDCEFNTQAFDARPVLRSLLSPVYRTPPSRFYVLRNVHVQASAWLMSDEQGLVFRETLPPWITGFPALMDNKYHRDRFAKGVTGVIEEPVCSFLRTPLWNYFHWHMDCLASLFMAESLWPGEMPYLMGPHLQSVGFHAQTLKLLDVPEQGFKNIDGTVLCRTVVLPSRSTGFTEPCRFSSQLFDHMRERVVGPQPPVTPAGSAPRRKLYLARFDAPGRREISNERELAQALESHGFEIITPGKRLYADQIRLLSAADVVVGPHGAGLTNIGFCRPGTLFVEIHPADYAVDAFVRLASSRGMKSHCYLVDPCEGQGQSSRMELDVADFIGQIGRWGLLAD